MQVEFHEFETWETRPSIAVSEASPDVQRLVKELVRHKRRFEQVRSASRGGAAGAGKGHELGSFWLRKTRKCVLCMLMVKRAGEEEPTFFAGMNIEVSMPTGTLCSERNAIGTALASDPSLKRCDMKMIAVLSVALDPPTFALPPPTPAAAAEEGSEARTAVGATPLLPTTSSGSGVPSSPGGLAAVGARAPPSPSPEQRQPKRPRTSHGTLAHHLFI